MDSDLNFVVTPWRGREELLQVRRDFYSRGENDRREKAVNKVLAWRSRKPDLPLLLDSTADIVDVVLQDEKGELALNALRLLYATAISRFITGLSDTQIELTRDRPSWFPPGKTLQLPTPLLEIRHRIVHRHLPTLAELKRAAIASLEWLWEWYWTQLDQAFSIVNPTEQEQESASDILSGILKAYVKKRKSEIKTRRKDSEMSKAADNALSTYALRFAPNRTSQPPAHTQTLLIRLLINSNTILPTDKKLGSSMSGAFLIWTPLLLTFSLHSPSLPPALLTHMMDTMNAPTGTNIDTDPTREGMCEWLVHILCSDEWKATHTTEKALQDILMRCFSAPTYWNLKLAARLLQDKTVPGRDMWIAVLAAAGGDDNNNNKVTLENKDAGHAHGHGHDHANQVDPMHIDETQTDLPVHDKTEQQNPKPNPSGDQDTRRGRGKDKEEKPKIQGPQKFIGLWKPRPIGTLPDGWEDD